MKLSTAAALMGLCLALGIAAGWAMRQPVVKIEERIVTKTEVKWRTNERIVTLPGATVYRDREGNTTITGPVEITATRSGEESTHSDTSRLTASCPPPPGYALGGTWGIHRDNTQTYGLMVGRRMLGPLWVWGNVLYPPGTATLTAGVTF